MRIILDIGHPAHVHLFRNAIVALNDKGHQVQIATRDKDVALQLLDGYGFQYRILTQPSTGYLGLFAEYIAHSFRLYQMARELQPDLLIGCTPSVGLVSKLCAGRSIIFSEDDPEVVRLAALLTYPPADVICMPDCIGYDLGSKRISHSSYHELAYLHPNRYTPNPSILATLDVREGEPYFVLRFVALRASHDTGHEGLSLDMRRKLIRSLSKRGRVFITSEGALPEEFASFRIRIPPERIHDALSFATLLVSDSQTMTMEAAMLGTPSVRCNTFVGRLSVLEELEHRYQLTFGFRPESEDQMFSFIMELLDRLDLTETWQRRRQRMLAEKIDLTSWMVDLVERCARGEM